MKLRIMLIALLFSISFLYAKDTVLDYFAAKSDGKIITVEWKVNDETGVSQYAIERSFGNQPFKQIALQDASGSGSNYKYADEEAYMRLGETEPVLLGKNVYTYRIKIIKSDNGISYSNNLNVVHNVSAVRRTWGMIKEMFK